MFGQLDRRIVLDLLNELDRRDLKREIFGSKGHDYRLRPPLAISIIERFEKEQEVGLPLDYRYFITEIGDGGAGPYYGVFPFGQTDDLGGYGTWNSMTGDFSQPFPHVSDWNLPDSFWANQPNPTSDTLEEEEDRLWEAWDKVLEEKYWTRSLVSGAIPICHLGCAYRQWLVINGQQKGYVWSDDRVDNKGLHPLRDQSRNQLTFSEWYLSWLYDGLRRVGSTIPLQSANSAIRWP